MLLQWCQCRHSAVAVVTVQPVPPECSYSVVAVVPVLLRCSCSAASVVTVLLQCRVQVLFQPSLIGLEQAGLTEIIANVLKPYSQEIQLKIFDNVLVTGGASLTRSFSGLPQLPLACPVCSTSRDFSGLWGGARWGGALAEAASLSLVEQPERSAQTPA